MGVKSKRGLFSAACCLHYWTGDHLEIEENLTASSPNCLLEISAEIK